MGAYTETKSGQLDIIAESTIFGNVELLTSLWVSLASESETLEAVLEYGDVSLVFRKYQK